MAIPPTNSRSPPIPVCDMSGMGGIPAGMGGKLNSFMVPFVMKMAPVTIRSTLNMRLGHGDGAGTKRDIQCVLQSVK
jgi:hypothetical protein